MKQTTMYVANAEQKILRTAFFCQPHISMDKQLPLANRGMHTTLCHYILSTPTLLRQGFTVEHCVCHGSLSRRGLKSHSGQLSIATSKNPSVVNTIYIYVCMYIYIYIYIYIHASQNCEIC